MQPPERESEYWDAAAAVKRFGHPFDAERFAAALARAPGAGPLPSAGPGREPGPRRRVLDLGCGYGRLTAELAGRGFGRVVGVDASAEMLRRARPAASPSSGVALVRAAADRLPLRSRALDAAVLFSLWTCVPDPGTLRALMDEVRRVLAPGGVLYVSDLLLQEDERNRARYRRGLERYGIEGVFELPEGPRDRVVLRHFPRAEVDALTTGFEPLELRELDVTTMNGNPARAFQYLGRRRADGAAR